MSDMLSVHLEGLDDLRARLRQLSREDAFELRKNVSAAGGLVRDEVVSRIHSPHGHARAGIKVYVNGSGLKMKALIRAATRQAIFSQRSRGPGKTPPPMKAARAIARQYGIPVARSRALAIAIGRRGTEGHPVMRAAFDAVRPRAELLFRQAFLAAVLRVVKR